MRTVFVVCPRNSDNDDDDDARKQNEANRKGQTRLPITEGEGKQVTDLTHPCNHSDTRNEKVHTLWLNEVLLRMVSKNGMVGPFLENDGFGWSIHPLDQNFFANAQQQ